MRPLYVPFRRGSRRIRQEQAASTVDPSLRRAAVDGCEGLPIPEAHRRAKALHEK
jgi:hypothetical protein